MTAPRPGRAATADDITRQASAAFEALGTRLPADHFLAAELPAGLRPERLVGRSGDPTLVSYERPEEDLRLIGLGEAGAAVLGPGARPRDARSALAGLLAARCEWLGPSPRPEAMRPRVFAGFAFDPDGSRTGPWRGFGSGLLRLPAVLLVREGGVLGAIVAPGVDRDVLDRVRRMLLEAHGAVEAEPDAESAPDGPQPPDGSLSLRTTVDIPREAMARSIERLAREVRDGVYEKVVIAGQREVAAAEPIDIARSVERLRADYPACHVFTITCGDATFLGASPELLVRLAGGSVSSLGLAGSAPRGETPEEDRRFGEELLGSAKNRIEHEIVVRALREALSPLTTELRAPNGPGLRRLRNIQHLSTEVAARAAAGVDVLTLLDRLHPTPAVCGWPTEAARSMIADHESFDRGWYAGPVGWVDAEGQGEFAVALRSALVRGERAWLFAGAGIMGDSQPDAELAEIDLKFRPLTTALATDTP